MSTPSISSPILLQHSFDDTSLNLTLELFLRMAHECLGNHLLSVMLHGSLLFGDLAPGYGDLDFVAIVDQDLNEETIQQLSALRRPLRDGRFGLLAHMIEGPFLPRPMLNQPTTGGSAFCWGTSREYPWDTNRLGSLVLRLLQEQGIIVFGKDLRAEIPVITDAELFQEIAGIPSYIREHGKPGTLHSIDWLLTAARMLLWLKENRFSSKSEAADWAYRQNPSGWRSFLPRAKTLRKRLDQLELPDTHQWLQCLGEPIQDAADELEKEVTKHRP